MPKNAGPIRQFCHASLMLGLIAFTGCHAAIKQSNITHPVEAYVPASQVIEARPEWFACKVKTDCTVTQGICGADHAVNRLSLSAFFHYRDQMNQSIGCTNKTQETPGHTTQCIQHRCSLNPPNHQP